ncbi:MAG: hypothetical protein R3231_02360 [bacterium]|nr:hypothetical protein [bacterium]
MPEVIGSPTLWRSLDARAPLIGCRSRELTGAISIIEAVEPNAVPGHRIVANVYDNGYFARLYSDCRCRAPGCSERARC